MGDVRNPGRKQKTIARIKDVGKILLDWKVASLCLAQVTLRASLLLC